MAILFSLFSVYSNSMSQQEIHTVVWLWYIILNAVASVALVQDSYPASEGMMVEVCAVIDNLPSDGLECPVVASLVAVDDKAGE